MGLHGALQLPGSVRDTAGTPIEGEACAERTHARTLRQLCSSVAHWQWPPAPTTRRRSVGRSPGPRRAPPGCSRPGRRWALTSRCPRGAQLVGPVFSKIGQRSPIEGGEWFVESQQAYLLADGDIVDVSDDLVEQLGGADAAGDSLRTTRSATRTSTAARSSASTPSRTRVNSTPMPSRSPARRSLVNGLRTGRVASRSTSARTSPSRGLPVQGVVFWTESSVQVPDVLPDAPEACGGPDTVTTDVEGDPDLDGRRWLLRRRSAGVGLDHRWVHRRHRRHR